MLWEAWKKSFFLMFQLIIASAATIYDTMLCITDSIINYHVSSNSHGQKSRKINAEKTSNIWQRAPLRATFLQPFKQTLYGFLF